MSLWRHNAPNFTECYIFWKFVYLTIKLVNCGTIWKQLSYSWLCTCISWSKWWVKPGFTVHQTSHLYYIPLEYTLEYSTFVITFINLFIADVQVPQGGFEGRVINSKLCIEIEHMIHYNKQNDWVRHKLLNGNHNF
jgi:hypothetical protein